MIGSDSGTAENVRSASVSGPGAEPPDQLPPVAHSPPAVAPHVYAVPETVPGFVTVRTSVDVEPDVVTEKAQSVPAA